MLETCGKVLIFIVSRLIFALDDDKFCILIPPFFFSPESECEQKGKEKL